jgi:hypothetical protein
MNELYNYESSTINMELLSQLIEKIAHVEIKEVIKKMVKFHGYDRITFTELEEMLYDVLEGDCGDEGRPEREDEVDCSRLKDSIHKINQSGMEADNQYADSKNSHMISYQTGASSHR